jgi:hypothetical protein
MRTSFLLRALAGIFGLGFAAMACGPSGGGDTSGSGGGGGTPLQPSGFSCSGKKVDFQVDVAPQIAAHCAAVEGCHVNMHDPSGAYKQMVDVVITDECKEDHREWVVPGDPEHSYMIRKVTDKDICAGSSPMPKPFQTGSSWVQLPDPIIQTFYDWICQGAKND